MPFGPRSGLIAAPPSPDEPAGPASLSPKQVAHILGVRYETVHSWIRKGRLRAQRDAHGYHILMDDVQALIDERASTAESRRREFHDRLDVLAACWRAPREVEQQR